MRAIWVTIGLIGWAGVIWIGLMLASLDPPRAGDDLRLVVDAAGRIVAGQPLYVTVTADAPLRAESLFYSYPPPVAQSFVPVSGLPFGLILSAWCGCAVAGLFAVARSLGRRVRDVVLPVMSLAPYTLPFAIALLFGNLDAWFPFSFGLVLLAVDGSRTRSRTAAIGGAALGAMSVAKIFPASLALWLVLRATVERRSSMSGAVVLFAGLACLGIVGVSLVVDGTAPWIAYVDFLRSVAGTTDIVNPGNIGPASQFALLLDLDDAQARTLQVFVTLAALAVTIAAARLIRDPVTSFGWATVASFVILPVTWVHYPVALIPVAIAALVRSRAGDIRTTAGLVIAALVVAAAALVVPVVMWIAVGLVLAATHASGRSGSIVMSTADAPGGGR